MSLQTLLKPLVRRVFRLRIRGNPVHRVLAWEYRARRLAWFELQRILYFQPMFESLCRSVGGDVRLELAPESRLPAMGRVDLELGSRVRLSARTTFNGARNAPRRARIVIGDDTYVGHRCVFMSGHEIRVGRHVLIASNALICSDPGHPVDAVARRTEAAPAESLGRIEIGDDVWLAYNVTVVGNVRIGEGSIVAANSVVVRDVPPWSLVAGNPARVIRELREGRERGKLVPISSPARAAGPGASEALGADGQASGRVSS
jgi:acetyltransferase-like isoleucine patch superfamily enzyme